ncbi:MAG: penicillin-binding protein 2 [Microthrixaceae bacterium]
MVAPSSGPEDNRLRLSILGMVIVGMFAALFSRLYYLQVVDRQTFQEASRAVHTRTKHEEAPRGRILDRNGKVLVDNRVVVVLGIDKERARSKGLGDGDGDDKPAQTARREATFKRLASMLTRDGIPTKYSAIETLYRDKRYGPNDFIPILDHDVGEDMRAYVSEHHDDFPGVIARARTVRFYPYGTLAAQLLGYVGRVIESDLRSDVVTSQGTVAKPASGEAKPYSPADEIGKGGVERAFERYLRGTPGDTVIQVDARGRRIGTLREPRLRPGDDLWLTIDIDLQALVEQRLAAEIAARGPGTACDKVSSCNAREGSSVIIDPSNGPVLAMASYPTFDPTLLVNGISTETWNRLNSKAAHKPMLNRAIAESYAPGSTFKLVTAHAALTEKLITPEFVWNDRGTYRLEGCTSGKCVFQNAEGEAAGSVDLRRAITVSSDTYFYRIGDLLWRGRQVFGDDAIQTSAREFGFGRRSGIDLPSESSGLVGTPQWLRRTYDANPKLWDHREWTVGDNVNVSIGQGLISVTPLQLANAYATFANGGTLRVPSIALRVTRPKAMNRPVVDLTNVELVRSFEPVERATVRFPEPNQYSVMYQGFQGVTASPAGTASKEFRQAPTVWPLAGKTGTAQVLHKADTSLFVAFGPATGLETSRYAMATIIPEAGYGAHAAAPMTFSVLQAVSRGEVPAAPVARTVDPTAPSGG